MKTNKLTKDYSSAYRTISLDKINAPRGVNKNEPKSVKFDGKKDLRGGKC